ncbi:MAG: hypothetical protein CML69_09820 [Rhodobacteraceae bacterium]|nr:hypothetical protein [Paracoccaceae bacterium]
MQVRGRGQNQEKGPGWIPFPIILLPVGLADLVIAGTLGQRLGMVNRHFKGRAQKKTALRKARPV